MAADGEIDPRVLVERLWRRGAEVYLPVIEGPRMRFARYRPRTPLVPNRFRIPEPRAARGRRLDPRRLDAAVVPLVAFDAAGRRLGMGGGYYDRAFAFLRGRRHWRRPRLLGAAYAFQEVERLPDAPWDVALDAVATERGLAASLAPSSSPHRSRQRCATG